MRVVVAPDSFKGSVTAPQAALAIAEGWSSVRPRDEVRCVPMADGGEGTLEALVRADPAAERRTEVVPGPDGRPVRAGWALLPGGVAVVELAAASGLALLDRPRPLTASTRGFGALIAAALDAGATSLRLAIGGSASTDGGAGMLAALGAVLLDAGGRPLPAGGGALSRLARVDTAGLRAVPPGGALVLTDVRAPLLGPRGAAAVYGPQKGASPADVAVLERGLAALAAALPADPDAVGAGAAGGTGSALLAWGGRLVPGAPAVAAAVGLAEAIAGAGAVLTGEGRFDATSSAGKAPAEVARLAAAAGIPVLLVAGAIDAPTDGFADAVALTDAVGREAALADPVAALRTAARTLAVRHGRRA